MKPKGTYTKHSRDPYEIAKQVISEQKHLYPADDENWTDFDDAYILAKELLSLWQEFSEFSDKWVPRHFKSVE